MEAVFKMKSKLEDKFVMVHNGELYGYDLNNEGQISECGSMYTMLVFDTEEELFAKAKELKLTLHNPDSYKTVEQQMEESI